MKTHHDPSRDGPGRPVLLDLTPLRRHRDYRRLFVGQFVSAFGSFITYVALPVQLFELTRSPATVGLLGIVQLLPLAATALWGGALADVMDRRRLLLICETLLLAASLTLALNAMQPQPSVVLLFGIAGLMSAITGFHSPALESLTPRLVERDELHAVSALSSARGTTAAIAGPAVAGVSIAALGVPSTFSIDALTYAVSLLALLGIRSIPVAAGARPPGLSAIREAFAYAASRPELLGTYLVDILAMTFAMPMAVFPALAERWGGAHVAGYLYSAMSIGGLAVSLFSGWTRRVTRHGAAVVLAAMSWGAAIAGLGLTASLGAALTCLVIAGAADMVSGLFRQTIWNQTIPARIRGRMASIEQLSYMTGPLLGNARVGFMAGRFGLTPAISWGGLACVLGVAATIPLLPSFWRYRRPSGDGSGTLPEVDAR